MDGSFYTSEFSRLSFLSFDRLARELSGMQSQQSHSLLIAIIQSLRQNCKEAAFIISSLAQISLGAMLFTHVFPFTRLMVELSSVDFVTLLMHILKDIPVIRKLELIEWQLPSLIVTSAVEAAEAENGEYIITVAIKIIVDLVTGSAVHFPDMSTKAIVQVISTTTSDTQSFGSAKCVTLRILSALVEYAVEHTMPVYDQLLDIALKSLNDYDNVIRQCGGAMFRSMVGYAAIARSRQIHKICIDSKTTSGTTLSSYLLTRSSFPRLFPTTPQEEKLPISQYTDTCMLSRLRLVSTFLKGTDGQGGLRGYQWDGVFWMTNLRRCGLGAALCDEMGTGKTVQAIAALVISRLEDRNDFRPMLVVCPSSVILHWEMEIIKFVKDLSILEVWIYKSQHDLKSLSTRGNLVVVVSYSMLAKEKVAFSQILWDTVILDEVHLIRNPMSAISLAVFDLKAKFKIALSGTPIQNQVEDVWSTMNFIIPGFLGAFETFDNHFVKPIRQSLTYQKRKNEEPSVFLSHNSLQDFYEISAIGLDKLKCLHTQILPFILRRLKCEVLAELPPKTIVDIFCPLSVKQRQMYRHFQATHSITDESLEIFLKTQSLEMCTSILPSTISVIAACTYLRFLCLHPSIVISVSHVAYKNRLLAEAACSGKVLGLAHLLEDAGIVFGSERVIGLFENSNELIGEELLDDYLIVADEKGYSPDEDEEDDDHDEVENQSHLEDEKSRYSKIDLECHDGEEVEEEVEKEEQAKDEEQKNVELKNETVEKCYSKSVYGQGPVRPLENSRTDIHETIINQFNSFHSSRHYKKCLIYTEHRNCLDIIETCVLKRFFPTVSYERLDGSVPPLTRAKKVERFNSSSLSSSTDIRILIMTTGSCGLGINLSSVDTVIFVQPNLNPYVDLQAMDRVHRIGQTKPVTIYRLLAEDTLETQGGGNFIEMKEKLFNKIINSENDGRSMYASQACNDKSGLSNRGTEFGATLWQSLKMSYGTDNTYEPVPPRSYPVDDCDDDIDLNSFLKHVEKISGEESY